MAGLPELFNFVTKFSNLWRENKSARLAAECHGGKATISLHLQLGDPEEVNQAPPPRRPSPSRLRRRERRAQARAEAAANAAKTAASEEAALKAAKLTDTAVQTVEERTTLVETAAQAVSATKEVAVQVVLPEEPVQPSRHVPAVSAGWHPHLPHVPAVSAAQSQPRQSPAAGAAHLRLHQHVQAGHAPPHLHYQVRHLPQDVFCPDDEYNDEEYDRNRANVRNTLQMIEDALNFSR